MIGVLLGLFLLLACVACMPEQIARHVAGVFGFIMVISFAGLAVFFVWAILPG